MTSPRPAHFARRFSRFLALLALASALLAALSSVATEPLWRRLVLPTSLALLAAANWVAPTDVWLTLSATRKRLCYGLVATAILLSIVKLYWLTCARGGCVAI